MAANCLLSCFDFVNTSISFPRPNYDRIVSSGISSRITHALSFGSI
jgi:hypothetical protein